MHTINAACSMTPVLLAANGSCCMSQTTNRFFYETTKNASGALRSYNLLCNKGS